jgi:hypothetical protein
MYNKLTIPGISESLLIIIDQYKMIDITRIAKYYGRTIWGWLSLNTTRKYLFSLIQKEYNEETSKAELLNELILIGFVSEDMLHKSKYWVNVTIAQHFILWVSPSSAFKINSYIKYIDIEFSSIPRIAFNLALNNLDYEPYNQDKSGITVFVQDYNTLFIFTSIDNIKNYEKSILEKFEYTHVFTNVTTKVYQITNYLEICENKGLFIRKNNEYIFGNIDVRFEVCEILRFMSSVTRFSQIVTNKKRKKMMEDCKGLFF